jgi:hypothetical protein
MTTIDWPNHCGGCRKLLGLVADTQLVVDPSDGEMWHYECADKGQIADDDQKEGRPLRRLADVKPTDLSTLRITVTTRADALREALRPLPGPGLYSDPRAEELIALDAEFAALCTYQQTRGM